MIKLSIIIPIYNAEKYLRDTLQSIIHQLTKDVELILINDGSTDKSLDICNEYALNNSNVIIKTINNMGSGYARNVGIDCAKGEYLFFVDSDDILYENSIKTILRDCEKNFDFLVYSYYQSYRNSKNKQYIKLKNQILDAKKVRKNYEKYMVFSNQYLQGAPWNKIFKKEIIKKNKLKYLSLKRHQDEAFIITYMSYVNKIKISSEPVYVYFLNNTVDESLKFPKNYFEIRKELYHIFYENLKSWESSKISINYIGFSLLMSLRRMFLLTFSKEWKMNRKDRKEYVIRILNDELIAQIAKTTDTVFDDIQKNISKKSIIRKLYYKKYIELINKKKVKTILILSFISYKLKKFVFLLKKVKVPNYEK